MQETGGNAGTGSENRNYGYGKCPEELSGTENTWKDPISGSGPSPGSAGGSVLVFAKTQGAAGNLSKQIMAGGAGKYYLAVTEGVPGKQEGIFIDYLKKNGKANMSQAVPENTPGAKKAILHYRVLDQKEMNGKSRALLKIKLETGRHHQIRVQLSHAGIPLLGDRKYNPSGEKGTSLGLCSCGLEFKHPKTGKIMKFETEPQGTAFLDFVKKL